MILDLRSCEHARPGGPHGAAHGAGGNAQHFHAAATLTPCALPGPCARAAPILRVYPLQFPRPNQHRLQVVGSHAGNIAVSGTKPLTWYRISAHPCTRSAVFIPIRLASAQFESQWVLLRVPPPWFCARNGQMSCTQGRCGRRAENAGAAAQFEQAEGGVLQASQSTAHRHGAECVHGMRLHGERLRGGRLRGERLRSERLRGKRLRGEVVAPMHSARAPTMEVPTPRATQL